MELGSLFHMKITVSVTKSLHQDNGLCYLHLSIFFLYIHTRSWSMVSILDSLHHFSFQFIKNDSTAMWIRSRNVRELRVIWNCIIYRKGAIYMTKIERPFLAAKGFNTNLVQCLPPFYVISSNVHVCSFTCTRCAPKRFCVRDILCKKKL